MEKDNVVKKRFFLIYDLFFIKKEKNSWKAILFVLISKFFLNFFSFFSKKKKKQKVTKQHEC